MSSPKLQLRHAWVSLGTDSFAKCEQGFAFCSFETGLRPSSPSNLADDNPGQRRRSAPVDEPLVIVMPRAAVVNLGQIDGRHVCVSVDPFCSLHALPHSAFRASLPVFTGFVSIIPQACGLAREYQSHAAPRVGGRSTF